MLLYSVLMPAIAVTIVTMYEIFQGGVGKNGSSVAVCIQIYVLDSSDLCVNISMKIHVCKMYTRKNTQVGTGLQTNCYKSVHKLSTNCVRTVCSHVVATSLE